jgi:hypothetical protein
MRPCWWFLESARPCTSCRRQPTTACFFPRRGCFDLWFCRPPPDGVVSSEDQDFGGQVAKDAEGALAMTFDLMWFEPGTMAALQRDSRATWGDPADIMHR